MRESASGSRTPQGTDAFSPTSQLADFADDEARWNWLTTGSDATARNTLSSPELREGLYFLQLDNGVLYRYAGGAWKAWESDWISYSAALSAASGTFSVGSGGSAAQVTQYRYELGRVRVKYKFVLGSSGAAMGTTPKFTLPVASASPPHAYAFYLGGTVFDASVTGVLLSFVAADNTSTSIVRIAYMNNIAGLFDYPTASTPWVWAAGDALQGEFVYDPA